MANDGKPLNTVPAAASTDYHDGPVHGALLPLVRVNGKVYVLDICVHIFPNPSFVTPDEHSSAGRSAKPAKAEGAP